MGETNRYTHGTPHEHRPHEDRRFTFPSTQLPHLDIPFAMRSVCALGPVAVALSACATDVEFAKPSETWKDPATLQPDAQGVVQLTMLPARVTIDSKPYCLRTYGGRLASLIDVPTSSKPRRLRIDLNNEMATLDPKPISGSSCTEKAQLHPLNVTNLHAHGLHVSPERTADGAFQSDNVLLEVPPRGSEKYRFDLDEPDMHDEGTFWFHPHVHGSTAIQVANGVAGALIIRGRTDELPGIKEARERVFLLQQIPFNYSDPKNPASDVKPITGDCNDGTLSIDDFPLAIAADRTLVNGVLAPTLAVTQGQVERWRFIHAGISQEITLELRPKIGSSCSTTGSTSAVMKQIAADGITFRAAERVETLKLEPGYRADVMVKAPAEVGTYCLVDTAQASGLNGSEPENVVAYLEVRSGEKRAGDFPLDTALASVAKPTLDCNAPLSTPVRPMVFAQQRERETRSLCEGQCPDGQPIFNVDCIQFDKGDSPMALPFGKVEEWHLSSELSDHPFHIHVNPFTVCPDGGGTPHWKDTLFVRKAETAMGNGTDAVTSTPIRIRTEYTDFRGKFVMHCHKLQHEDEGMMRILDVR